MKTLNIKTSRLIRAGIGFCCVLMLLGLLMLPHSLQHKSAEAEILETNCTTDIFGVRGKNLPPNTTITVIRDDGRCSAVVATKFMWEQVFDVKMAPQDDETVEQVLAWALCRNIGLVALDISNPEQPKVFHTVHIDKFLWNLEIQEDKAYIACGNDGIVVCDISSPAEARVIYSITLPYPAIDVSVGPDTLYVSNGKNGISIIDSLSGEIIEHLELPGIMLRLAYRNAKLFALGRTDNSGFLRIYSVPKGMQAQLRETLEFDGLPRDYLFLNDNGDGSMDDAEDAIMYLANGSGGIGIVQTARDGSATFKGNIYTPFRCRRIVRYGDKIGVFGRTGNIAIYTPEANSIFGLESTFHACSRIYGVAIFGDYAVIAAKEKGITIVDLRSGKNQAPKLKAVLPALHDNARWKVTEQGIVVRHANKIRYFKYLSFPGSSDTNLELTGSIRFSSVGFPNAYAITDAATGTWIYAVIKGSGLHIIRVDADGTLEQTGIIELPISGNPKVNSCATYADKLYLCSTDGLLIFDISSPETPQFLGTEFRAQNILDITFGAHHAYISSAGVGAQICPIKADNTLGKGVAIDFPEHLISGSKSLDSTLADGILYIACGYRGILSVDVRDPQHPVILDSMELQGYCSRVQTRGKLLAAKAADTVYLMDISDPKRLGILCKLGEMQDFHINTKNNELLQLRIDGITSIPLPIVLEPTSASATRLEFHLPGHLQQGRYNIFINLNGTHSEPAGSAVCILNGTQRPKCTFTPTKSNESVPDIED